LLRLWFVHVHVQLKEQQEKSSADERAQLHLEVATANAERISKEKRIAGLSFFCCPVLSKHISQSRNIVCPVHADSELEQQLESAKTQLSERDAELEELRDQTHLFKSTSSFAMLDFKSLFSEGLRHSMPVFSALPANADGRRRR
jgi:hypothetical protein